MREHLIGPVTAADELGALRPRRLRRSAGLRRVVRETRLSVDQLLYPMFVVPGKGVETEIGSLPGQMQRSVDRMGAAAREVADAGIQAVLLFGQATVKSPARNGVSGGQRARRCRVASCPGVN